MVDFSKLREHMETRRSRLATCPPIVVIDVETTGFDPWNDRIFQLAASRIERGQELGTQDWYVNPGIPIPEECLARSSVKRANVEAAPPFWEAFNELAPRLEGAVLAAYHASFDKAFLLASVARTWPRSAFASVPAFFDRPWIDPLPLVWHFCPPPYSMRLGDVVRHLGVRTYFKGYNAEEDASATAAIVTALLGGWGDQLLPLENLFALQARLHSEREAHRFASKAGIVGKLQVPLASCDVCGKHQVLSRGPVEAPIPLGPGELPEGWVRRGEATLCGTACDFVWAWRQG